MLVLKRRSVKDSRSNMRPWTEDFIAEQGAVLALVTDRITHVDFISHCFDRLPRGSGKRDIRRQTVIRALHRMIEADRLPFKIEGEYFLL
jgi:hypothetical protein